MIKNTTITLISVLFFNLCQAQPGAIVNEGEIGISAGLAHYFGDINPNMGLQRPKGAVGIFFRKQFGDYVSVRLNGQFAEVAYSDFRSKNKVQQERNLSFNSDIYSVSIRGDFNFFRYIPGSNYYRFTPFVSIGIGKFWFNPYTYLPFNPKPIFLRDLQIEGVGYEKSATIIPIGFGVKYNLKKNINLGFELTHNITLTDYLDDVSGFYKDPDFFIGKNNTPVNRTRLALHDRSDPSKPYGQTGKMRGFGSQLNDTYVTAEVTLSISFSSYRCPKAY
jgi:hypothetical protein